MVRRYEHAWCVLEVKQEKTKENDDRQGFSQRNSHCRDEQEQRNSRDIKSEEYRLN